ncbi:insulin-like 7 precursor [Elysia marginata]|uniref:Insulin-like 7 n=1 Tax=Elysia marginata TaxID=1093978 RepID=A0AAV4EHV4_9GAST|nr:insulin-like 7 precursor [Elysia marginata]
MYQRLSDSIPVLLAVVSSLCLSQALASSTCDYHGTPHPRGHCGAALFRIHRNVCNVLRIHHPEFFRNAVTSSTEKRAASGNYSKLAEQQKLSMVVHMLRNAMEPEEQQVNLEPQQLPTKTERDYGQGDSLSSFGNEPLGSLGNWPDAQFLTEDTLEEANWLSDLLKGRGKRATTQEDKRVPPLATPLMALKKRSQGEQIYEIPQG